MKVLIALFVSCFSVACATNVAQQDPSADQARLLKHARAENELLARRLYDLTLANFDNKRVPLGQATAFGIEEPVDVSALAAMRLQRRVVRSEPVANGCDGATQVSIKNETEASILLMIDYDPVVLVGPTFLTDFVGSGVTAYLCLPTDARYTISGGTYEKLTGPLNASDTFVMPLEVEADPQQVNITESMLSGSSR